MKQKQHDWRIEYERLRNLIVRWKRAKNKLNKAQADYEEEKPICLDPPDGNHSKACIAFDRAIANEFKARTELEDAV